MSGVFLVHDILVGMGPFYCRDTLEHALVNRKELFGCFLSQGKRFVNIVEEPLLSKELANRMLRFMVVFKLSEVVVVFKRER